MHMEPLDAVADAVPHVVSSADRRADKRMEEDGSDPTSHNRDVGRPR